MNNFFKLFKRKPRIIPFNTLRDLEKELLEKYREMTPENKRKVLSFAAYRHLAGVYKTPENPQGKCKITSFEYRNFENTGHCKLDFIWDRLP